MAYLIPLNLQRFAEPQTTLLTGLSTEMKTFYESTLIDNAEPSLVHDQFGDDYPIDPNKGKTIEFRRFSPLAKAMTPIVEGVLPAGNSLNVTKITAEVFQYGDFTRLTDVLRLTAIDNVILQTTKLHGNQAGRTLDTVTRDILCGGTQVRYAPTEDGAAVTSRSTLDATCRLTPDLIYLAAADLAALNTPKIDGSYVAIIHPYTKYDLMRTPEWISTSQYGKVEQYFRGEIGMIGNVRFVESSEAKIWTGGTCPEGLAVFGTIVLGANAYGVTSIKGAGMEIIVKPQGYADELNLISSVGWKAMKTAERLVETSILRIESTSAYSATASAN